MENKFKFLRGDSYERVVGDDTETPSRCHIAALYYVSGNQTIPSEILESVVQLAVRNRDSLREAMELANKSIKLASMVQNRGKVSPSFNTLIILNSIAASYGIDGPKGRQKRRQMLGDYLTQAALNE